MTNKLLFSVIKKSSDGCVLRNTQTRIEQFFAWNDIKSCFKESGSKWLYEMNEENPIWKQADELSEKIGKEMVEIMTAYLFARSGDTIRVLVFGDATRKFMEKYQMDLITFQQIFRNYHKQMFGVYPSMDKNQILSFS